MTRHCWRVPLVLSLGFSLAHSTGLSIISQCRNASALLGKLPASTIRSKRRASSADIRTSHFTLPSRALIHCRELHIIKRASSMVEHRQGPDQQSKGSSTMADTILSPIVVSENVGISGWGKVLNRYRCPKCGSEFIRSEIAIQLSAMCNKCSSESRGSKKHPLYRTWVGMMKRCGDPKNGSYRRYGGRGIRVCEQWQSFDRFLLWSEISKWRNGLQIDRINNDGNYEPGNCRWATPKENIRNSSSTILTVDDVRCIRMLCWSGLPYNQAAKLFPVSPCTVRAIMRFEIWGDV